MPNSLEIGSRVLILQGVEFRISPLTWAVAVNTVLPIPWSLSWVRLIPNGTSGQMGTKGWPGQECYIIATEDSLAGTMEHSAATRQQGTTVWLWAKCGRPAAAGGQPLNAVRMHLYVHCWVPVDWLLSWTAATVRLIGLHANRISRKMNAHCWVQEIISYKYRPYLTLKYIEMYLSTTLYTWVHKNTRKLCYRKDDRATRI